MSIFDMVRFCQSLLLTCKGCRNRTPHEGDRSTHEDILRWNFAREDAGGVGSEGKSDGRADPKGQTDGRQYCPPIPCYCSCYSIRFHVRRVASSTERRGGDELLSTNWKAAQAKTQLSRPYLLKHIKQNSDL